MKRCHTRRLLQALCAALLAAYSPLLLHAARPLQLREVTVSAKLPMKEIGVQKTAIDSSALKENISLSMADILTFNSSVFVKSYGRATLSTVAFRGTSPSHTQVTWNGMKINSPMLGMTDFSTIPSYFIDNAALLHGTSSVNETGGGLGGMVRLATSPEMPEGWHAQYVQGIGSFKTFDEFLRVSFSNGAWSSSTRAVYASSPNRYPYVNHDKMVNTYDDEGNITGREHPTEHNRSGSYKDLHLLQEIYFDTRRGDRFGLNAWYMSSNRELPMLTTDYGLESTFENRQREETLRTLLSWRHSRSRWSTEARAGYIHTWMAYDYRRDVGGGGGMATMTRARSHINTFFGQADASLFSSGGKWLFTGSLSAHHHHVASADKNSYAGIMTADPLGYDKRRLELSGSVSAKWRPVDRLGLSAVIREDLYGDKATPLIPAFFIDGIISKTANIRGKASISRNYRFPTLNDLYFVPGGNPDLRSEHGFSYDCGLSFDIGKPGIFAAGGSIGWFDSHITDWIIWLPTTKGFFSPRNMKKVHAYGIEAAANGSLQMPHGWLLTLNGTFTWSPSINEGDPLSDADRSVGKQLPYVPRCSASVTGNLAWRRWSFLYKWAWYSERFTMSSNDTSLSGKLPPYFMSNISLGYTQPLKWADLDFKLAVNNLFDEDYLSVLSRPMPGINFELFIGITPKW